MKSHLTQTPKVLIEVILMISMKISHMAFVNWSFHKHPKLAILPLQDFPCDNKKSPAKQKVTYSEDLNLQSMDFESN